MQASNFSNNLIQETIATFREEDGISLSEEEAINILNSLGGLFLAFSHRSAPPAPQEAAGGDALAHTYGD